MAQFSKRCRPMISLAILLLISLITSGYRHYSYLNLIDHSSTNQSIRNYSISDTGYFGLFDFPPHINSGVNIVVPYTETPTATNTPIDTDTPSPTDTLEATDIVVTETPTPTETQSFTATETFVSETPIFTNTPTIEQTPTSTETPTPSATLTSMGPTATETLIPVGQGIYDDNDSNIVYSSNWIAYNISGDYSSTDHYTSTIGSTASLTFELSRPSVISILYRANQYLGVMNVSANGTSIGNIDQYYSGEVYQRRWDSPILTAGTYTLTLTHTSGSDVTLDAILIDIPSSAGTYDDTNQNIYYSQGWSLYTNSGDYSSTDHYSNVVGSTASFAFELTQPGTLSILYRANSPFGVMNIAIDGVSVADINQYASSQTFQLRWDSSSLSTGVHTLTVTHTSGDYVSLDAILINIPVNQGIYDDSDSNLFYSSGWSIHPNDGNYNSSDHFSSVIGSSVYLPFYLEQPGIISVIYRTNDVSGNMNVYVDGSLVGTIDQYSDTQLYQQRWDSSFLEAGVHTLKLTHADSLYVQLDAIFINVPATPTPLPSFTPTVTATPLPVSAGTYDDTDSNIVYSSNWSVYTNSGDYSSSDHYSNVIGSNASLTFELTRSSVVSLIYRANQYMGTMNVSANGTSIGDIDQYYSTQSHIFQRRWDSPILTAGTYTLTLTHTSGSYVTLDAILIDIPSSAGTYDDTNQNIYYSQGWSLYTNSGDYSSTDHYSNVVGSTASFAFELTQPGTLSILYRANSPFGVMNIAIDGVSVADINQYASSQTFQLRWDSSSLSTGVHTLTVTHTSGDYVSLDAIFINTSN